MIPTTSRLDEQSNLRTDTIKDLEIRNELRFDSLYYSQNFDTPDITNYPAKNEDKNH